MGIDYDFNECLQFFNHCLKCSFVLLILSMLVNIKLVCVPSQRVGIETSQRWGVFFFTLKLLKT